MYVFIHMGLCMYMYAYMSISVYICTNIYIYIYYRKYVYTLGARSGLVVALRYDPEGRGFDSRWLHYDPGLDPTFNISEYQEYFLGGGGVKC
jgi:hypothetical protein